MRLFCLFVLASLAEPVGVWQIMALLPLYLREMGVPEAEIPQWVGSRTTLVFLVALPFVPLWGAWADKYSRKLVIVRSALVEAVVLAGVALSRGPWELGGSILLMGLTLGNTGVMLAMLHETAPAHRLGLAIAGIGAAGSLGAATGPALAGVLVDRFGFSLSQVFATSSGLMFAVTAVLALSMPDLRPALVPAASSIRIAVSSIRGVVADGPTRGLFLLSGAAILASQMTSVYLPLVVQRVNGERELVSAIAAVMGTAALAGGLASPLLGALGDRIGFRTVLAGGLAVVGVSLAAMPSATSVAVLVALATLNALCFAAVRSMVFALLAIEVSAERRGSTLNLVYLPLYLAGILGPAASAIVVGLGLAVPYYVAGAVCAAGAASVVMSRRARAGR